MKKLFGILILFSFAPKLHAGTDAFGNLRPAVWHSSRTAQADSFAMIGGTTPTCILLHSVTVASAAPNAYMSLYNASTTVTQSNVFSTVAIIAADQKQQLIFDVPYSSGLVYNKIGASDIIIEWAYQQRPPSIPFRPFPFNP